MILAGDIGGTKTNLALFSKDGGGFIAKAFGTYASKNYSNLGDIVKEFLKEHAHPIENASFAIAGPVHGGVCRATNLPWVIDAKLLSKELKIKHVYLLNDLEANAHAIAILPEEQLLTVHPGRKSHEANRAVISPGTGLGEAGLYWDGKTHRPFASEGGHCDFGPRTEIQLELCRYLIKKFGHASYERVISGPGLFNIYTFLKEELKRKEPEWLRKEFEIQDPAKVITLHGLDGKSELCVEALDLFSDIFASEASNCVLKFMALGGIYLGGGIPPKMLPKIKEQKFLDNFLDKGRFRALLEEVPITVILDNQASLKGAAAFCRAKMRLSH